MNCFDSRKKIAFLLSMIKMTTNFKFIRYYLVAKNYRIRSSTVLLMGTFEKKCKKTCAVHLVGNINFPENILPVPNNTVTIKELPHAFTNETERENEILNTCERSPDTPSKPHYFPPKQ